MIPFYFNRNGVVYARARANQIEILPYHIFDEIKYFETADATASIDAVKDSHIVSIPEKLFRDSIEKHPHAGKQIARGVLPELALRTRIASTRLANSIYRVTPERPQSQRCTKPIRDWEAQETEGGGI